MDDGEVLALGIVLWCFCAWVTHVIVCIQSSSWALLFIGSIIFPISWLHGTGVWFGIF